MITLKSLCGVKVKMPSKQAKALGQERAWEVPGTQRREGAEQGEQALWVWERSLVFIPLKS